MQDRRGILSSCCTIFIAAAFSFEAHVGVAAESGTVLTGKAAMGDWTKDAPGVRRKITVQDLPPASSNSLAINLPRVARRPADARLRVPPGFKIDFYADGFRDPRFLLAAPNGDIFVVESHSNQIRVLRDRKKSGRPDTNEIFTKHDLNRPFGIAFYPPGDEPQFPYVANTDGVIRFPYRNGDIKARGPAQQLAAHLSPVAAFHGSWNRMKRTGYKVVRVPFDHSTGKTRGEYEDFVTGFVTAEGKVWDRPVGITVAKDGGLLISEDGNGTIWRVSYGG